MFDLIFILRSSHPCLVIERIEDDHSYGKKDEKDK
jgi:hypothetical protein